MAAFFVGFQRPSGVQPQRGEGEAARAAMNERRTRGALAIEIRGVVERLAFHDRVALDPRPFLETRARISSASSSSSSSPSSSGIPPGESA